MIGKYLATIDVAFDRFTFIIRLGPGHLAKNRRQDAYLCSLKEWKPVRHEGHSMRLSQRKREWLVARSARKGVKRNELASVWSY